MHQFKKTRRHPFATLSVAAMSGIVFFVLADGLLAQSAEIFEDKKANTNSKNDSSPKKDLPPPEPVDSQPSRFAGQNIESYIAARAAVFSMRNRATDAFGLFQDPNIKPVIKSTPSKLPQKRQIALPPTPLRDIVAKIRVTTVMPGEKKFMVKFRTFSEGDEFPLSYQGKIMEIKVVEVTANRIIFKDMQKGEQAALETGMLPPGMIIAGDKEIRPPGMVSPDENLPLQIESIRSEIRTE